MQLEAALAEVGRRFDDLLAGSDPLVLKYVAEVGKTRGKMLRPRLMLTTAAGFGELNPRTAVNCAACCELLHTATLIHDDVIDEAATRRGSATLNHHFGNEVAVIVGDYLFSLVFKAIGGERDFQLIDMMVDTSQELGMGVLEEISNRDNLEMTVDQYLNVIYLKTAALFSLCCGMGSYLGGAGEAEIEATREYGKQFGLAFQIVDDLLDVCAEESATGKPGFNDLREGRITLPLIHALSEDGATTRELVQTFQRSPTAEPRSAIRAHLHKLGSLHYAYQSAGAYVEQARGLATELATGAPFPEMSDELRHVEERVLSSVPALATQSV